MDTLEKITPAMTSHQSKHTYTDHHGRPAKRRYPDSAWPWRRADGRTFAEADPYGAFGRRKLAETGGSAELTLYEKVVGRIRRERADA